MNSKVESSPTCHLDSIVRCSRLRHDQRMYDVAYNKNYRQNIMETDVQPTAKWQIREAECLECDSNALGSRQLQLEICSRVRHKI
jgi:hypothetical protein